jgi:CRP/FNR family transcriptional regulator, cyclic AMP receptor protein
MMKFGIERSYSAGELIFSEGETADFLPTVLSGRVKMVRYPEPGKEVIIGTFGGGEIFAIPPALDGKAFPSTAVAMEDCRILMVPRGHFLQMLEDSSEFSATVMSRMCGILRDRADTIQILSSASAEQRVARVLLSIADQSKNGLPLKVTLRRQDIAEMSGLTLESTIRSIRKLADRGLVTIVKGKIILEESDGLVRLIRN